MDRALVPKDTVEAALKTLRSNLADRLIEKGECTFASVHEVLGVIDEEQYELLGAIHSNNMAHTKQELLDIAVACVFAVACIDNKSLDW